MRTDDQVLELIKSSFATDAAAVHAPADLADTVRGRLRDRRRRIAVGGCTAVLALAATGVLANRGGDDPATTAHGTRTSAANTPGTSAPDGATRDVQLASFHFRVPVHATVSRSCLPGMHQYLVGPAPLGEQFLLVRAPASSPEALDGRCIGATIQFTQHPASVTSTVTDPGQQTVYLTDSAPGTRSGYVTLDAQQSRNAAAAIDGPPGQYCEVLTLPSDTSQSVLVAALRQYRPAG